MYCNNNVSRLLIKAYSSNKVLVYNLLNTNVIIELNKYV